MRTSPSDSEFPSTIEPACTIYRVRLHIECDSNDMMAVNEKETLLNDMMAVNEKELLLNDMMAVNEKELLHVCINRWIGVRSRWEFNSTDLLFYYINVVNF